MGPSVLLLKSPKADDPYCQLLSQAGFDVTSVPVLMFKYVNTDLLKKRLSNPCAYSGLLLTSQNAVEAISIAAEGTQVLNLWKEKKTFVVGEATAKKAGELGLICEGEHTGNVQNLLEYIKQVTKAYSTQKLLYPKTNLILAGPDNSLDETGDQIEQLTVYETGPSPSIFNDLVTYKSEKGAPEFVVFFSPSGIDFALEQVLGIVHIPACKILAIGPTTGAHLDKIGIKHLVVQKPTPQSLLDSLQSMTYSGGSH